MYTDDTKLFAKTKKEVEILIQAVRIYSYDVGMEFAIEKCTMLQYNAYNFRGARGVIVIVVGNEHSDTSSNPGRDWLHFT